MRNRDVKKKRWRPHTGKSAERSGGWHSASLGICGRDGRADSAVA